VRACPLGWPFDAIILPWVLLLFREGEDGLKKGMVNQELGGGQWKVE
jgi:hypothetical protein